MGFVLFITQSAVCCHARSAIFLELELISYLVCFEWICLSDWLWMWVNETGWFWVPGLSGEFLEHCPQNHPSNPNHRSQFPHSTSSIQLHQIQTSQKKEIQAKESRENEKRNSFLNLNRFFAFLRCLIWSRNLIHFAGLLWWIWKCWEIDWGSGREGRIRADESGMESLGIQTKSSQSRTKRTPINRAKTYL